MSIWGNRDYLKDHFWVVYGGLFGADGECLFSVGDPLNYIFTRSGSITRDGVTFVENEPVVQNKRYYHNGEITETTPSYDVSPITRPTAPDTISTAASAPNPDKNGLNWESSDAENDWVFSLLSTVGELSFKNLNIKPSVIEWKTIGDLNILSGGTGNQILYIESATGLACATDGTNTCKSLSPYTKETVHDINIVFTGSTMAVVLDGISGSVVPFVGSFSPGETLKWGLNNEDIFSIKDTCKGLIGRYLTDESDNLITDESGQLIYQ